MLNSFPPQHEQEWGDCGWEGSATCFRGRRWLGNQVWDDLILVVIILSFLKSVRNRTDLTSPQHEQRGGGAESPGPRQGGGWKNQGDQV